MYNTDGKVTADTSIRLGRFFGLTDRYFLDMQNEIDVRELIDKEEGELNSIKPYKFTVM